VSEVVILSLAASIILAAGAAIIFIRCARRRSRSACLVLSCPRTRQPADLVVIQDVESARFTGLISCSELGAGKRCRRSCLLLANIERAEHDRREAEPQDSSP
jgi:hypothetical protein